MDEFNQKMKEAITNGDYESWILFEQKRLRLFNLTHKFEEGEIIDAVWNKVEDGEITFKSDIDFNKFMTMQIKSLISNEIYRLKNKFDGYKDHETLYKYFENNKLFDRNELNYIIENIDLKRMKEIIFDEILADDIEANFVLEQWIMEKPIKEIAEDLKLTEKETYSALRRARYKIEKQLPSEFIRNIRRAI
ncbi:MAG: hypothetical protein CMF23_02145 [Ignavibacteriae bacterium]|nr:hypothetical protein [Ignavibacteriota bacterium]